MSEQAGKADALVDEALDAGLDGSHPLTVHAKMLRLELLNAKADLERSLGTFVLDCSDCGRLVHWVEGLGVSAGHWAHRELVAVGTNVRVVPDLLEHSTISFTLQAYVHSDENAAAVAIDEAERLLGGGASF